MKNKKGSRFYKYRPTNTYTLEALCQDRLFFANPENFNDPLDCQPDLECDSQIQDLRYLLKTLIQRREEAEILEHIKKAKLKSEKAQNYARQKAKQSAEDTLSYIDYYITHEDTKELQEDAERASIIYSIRSELLKHYERGVCCFATSSTSPLLWSHYGDQHKGLCIGYGLDRKPPPQMHKVLYGRGRSIKTSTVFEAFINKNDEAKNVLDRDVLLRKASAWKYEQEWRLIGPQGLQDSPLLMQEITFGLRCSWAVMYSVIKTLEGRYKPLKFYKIRQVPGKYILKRHELDMGEDFHDLPRVAQSGEEIFGDLSITNPPG